MKITLAQRISLLNSWQKVCRDRGWKTSDRALRLQTCGDILGRKLNSLDDVERMDECTRLMHGLEAMLGVSVQAAREADDPSLNRARVLRHHILAEIIPCLELYIEDVQAYVAEIMADKNRWWKIDRPARQITLLDLDAKPIFRTIEGELKEYPSQLEQMQYTLSRCLSQKRQEAGHTVHEMKIAARVPCKCAICSQNKVPAQRAPSANPVPELVGVNNDDPF